MAEPFSGIQWKVIRIVDGPIRSLDEAEELPSGEIGELIVRGPQVTREYVTRRESNALAKIADGGGVLAPDGRFGLHRRLGPVLVLRPGCPSRAYPDGPMYPVRCEAIFNQHPDIRRTPWSGSDLRGDNVR